MQDEELLDRARSGDEDAFQTLIREHYVTVEKFAYQLGVRHEDVGDVTQEVFIKVYRFIEKHTRGKFTTWLYQITLNVVRDMYRKKKRLERNKQEWSKNHPFVEENKPLLDADNAFLHEAIVMLDEKYKVPLVLHYFHDLSYSEIADVLNTNEGTIKTRISRAKQKLKVLLQKDGVVNE
ncbi:RNA polymerase sigma factor [Bacillus alkalicellulosilyticus]|uniref:RNA polymerase sigma factor n=1 Tax=Alkalihalobacterium alkalicellulosilyticum TaxID=1912214 RepID=UPI0009988905|nr:RNA polymerase sigma factor [Bacillus alkalicellulosilyticus]